MALLPFLGAKAMAGNYAYVYIEGDKQTPFYVKVEGKMMPRLGKNYCILSGLDAGITQIEVLFQQNKYPPQKFSIRVPVGGSRGFALQKMNGETFALYDLVQGSTLMAGNRPEDDRLPETVIARAVPAEPVVTKRSPEKAASSSVTLPAFEPQKAVVKTGGKSTKAPQKAAKQDEEDDLSIAEEAPVPANRFIDDIELNSVDGADQGIPKKKAMRNSKASTVKKAADRRPVDEDEDEAPRAPEKSGNCARPMSSEEFESFALTILDKDDDDAKLKLLSRTKGKRCFTTEQVRIIGNNLETQSGRYDAAKMLYGQTADKEQYERLESLFKTNYLKNKFRQILQGGQD